jgi:hypothetical protein
MSPVSNAETRMAREFHERTVHSPYSVRTSTHALDWDNKPFLFKVYPGLPEVELPRSFDRPSVDALVALAGAAAGPFRAEPFGLETLASVLFFSAGLTKRRTYPDGMEVHFRAAPSTGALYQTEVYVVAGAVEGLAAGVYHFSPGDFRLRRLREGDYRAALALAAADPEVTGRPRWSSPRSTGGTRGSTGRAGTGTCSGTPVPCWPTSWRPAMASGSPPACSPGSWTTTSTRSWASIAGAR